MGKFGWSLPPGVSTLPCEEEHPCEVCGEYPDNCICPECPVCGDIGNADCYIHHGMVRTEEQLESMERHLEDEEPYWTVDVYSPEETKQMKFIDHLIFIALVLFVCTFFGIIILKTARAVLNN